MNSTADDYCFGPAGTFSDEMCTDATDVKGTVNVSGSASCSGATNGATYSG